MVGYNGLAILGDAGAIRTYLMKARYLAILVLAAAGAGAAYYYERQAVTQPAHANVAPAQAPAAPVTVALVVQKPMPVRLSAVGNARAYAIVSVKSRVDGQIFKVGFQEGQLVHKGDLLFAIDPRPFEAALHQAQANLARDQATLQRNRLDLDRYSELLKKDFAPRQQIDQTKASVDSMVATLQADQSSIVQAQLNLEYCQIRSPIEGITGNLLVNEGNLVKANDTVNLVVINQVKPIYVSFSVAQQNLPEIKRRMAAGKLAVEVAIPGDDGPAETGGLTFINNSVDMNTGTIQLKATFPNDNGRLTPGQFVNVGLTLSTIQAALVVPAQAVQSGQHGNYVFVVKPDKTVEMRSVQLGFTIENEAIIDKGVQPGEQVVTSGQLRLFPGARVEIRNAA
jgi:membrane fusion protein, multidrug efflux system